MPDVDTELRRTATEACALLIGIERLLPPIEDTVGPAATGGGPRPPVPPKLAQLVADSTSLAELAAGLKAKALVLQELYARSSGHG
jgi:hypothetical protein